MARVLSVRVPDELYEAMMKMPGERRSALMRLAAEAVARVAEVKASLAALAKFAVIQGIDEVLVDVDEFMVEIRVYGDTVHFTVADRTEASMAEFSVYNVNSEEPDVRVSELGLPVDRVIEFVFKAYTMIGRGGGEER